MGVVSEEMPLRWLPRHWFHSAWAAVMVERSKKPAKRVSRRWIFLHEACMRWFISNWQFGFCDYGRQRYQQGARLNMMSGNWLMLGFAGAAMLLSSCASTSRVAAVLPKAEPVLYEWYGEGLQGPVKVDIVLDEQIAYVTIGGEDAGWSYLATGLPKYATPTGSFKILEKVVDKHSNLWGVIKDEYGTTVNSDARNGRDPVPPGGRFMGAQMPYWMRLTNSGIGMHVGVIPQPGLPASHGCIRLPRGFAIELFSVVKLGTPVTIRGSTPYARDYNLSRATGAVSSDAIVAMSTLR